MIDDRAAELPDPTRNTVRGLMLVILLGLVVVIISLVFLQWPYSTSGNTLTTVIHPLRITDRLSEQGMAGLPGVLLDIGVYLAVIVGLMLVGIAGVRGARRSLPGLMVIGLLGLAYAGGMVLYNGPMISICGFMLILFGGVVAWVASAPNEPLFDETMPSKPISVLPVEAVNTIEMIVAPPGQLMPTESIIEPETNVELNTEPTESNTESSDTL